MLVSEKKLSSADGVLLWPVSQGLNYQSAGAFQRLGARLLGILRPGETNALAATLPIKTLELSTDSKFEDVFGEKLSFKTLIWAPHPALSWNEAPPADALDLVVKVVRWVSERDEHFHPVFVVPQKTPREQLLKLQDSSPRATILLSPMAFGFRDDALMSRSLDVLRRKPSLLTRISRNPRVAAPLHAISFSDLAAHLVVVPQNESLFGKNVWIHGAEWTLQEWTEEFSRSFPVGEVSLIDKIGLRFTNEDVLPAELVERLLKSEEAQGPASSEARMDFVVHSDADFFPSPAPQLGRALKQHSRAFETYPELELVFTPGRSP
jgi:hypothetical protein